MAVKKIERSALLPYSAALLYAMVDDVERYPEFVPGCVGAEITRQGDNTREARLDLAVASKRYSLTTQNHMYPPERIEMKLLDAPFLRHLHGSWRFEPAAADSCQVHFEVVFRPAFGLGILVNRLSGAAADKVMQAMRLRAEHLYG